MSAPYFISPDVPAFVYQKVADRLSQCRKYTTHHPFCSCDDVTKCKNFLKCIEPTEFAMLPLKNYAEIAQKLEKIEMLEMLKPKKQDPKNTHVFLTISPAPDIPFA